MSRQGSGEVCVCRHRPSAGVSRAKEWGDRDARARDATTINSRRDRRRQRLVSEAVLDKIDDAVGERVSCVTMITTACVTERPGARRLEPCRAEGQRVGCGSRYCGGDVS